MLIFLKQCLLWLKQCLIWSVGFSALVVPPSLLTIYYVDPSRLGTQDTNPDSHAQPHAEITFDITAAADACKLETQERLHDVLLRSRVDWHSTRFQPNRNLFVVVLEGDIGSLRKFQQANIYCYVSPRTQRVSYFNAYDAEGKSYVSRAISFRSLMMTAGDS